MHVLSHLIKNNRDWAKAVSEEDPKFFAQLAEKQTPEYLWIGCADSRVPANQIVGLMPGEVFVHRNIANLVVHTDFNCLSVIEFAVAVLNVKHIIVCGHYGCGGVKAATQDRHLGLIDNWLRHIRDVHQKHGSLLEQITDETERLDRLCELNVVEQALNVCHTTVVQKAWKNKQSLAIHGWIYKIQDGLIRDMNITITHPDEVMDTYKKATKSSDES